MIHHKKNFREIIFYETWVSLMIGAPPIHWQALPRVPLYAAIFRFFPHSINYLTREGFTLRSVAREDIILNDSGIFHGGKSAKLHRNLSALRKTCHF